MSQLKHGLSTAPERWEACSSALVPLCAAAAVFSADHHLTQRNVELGGVSTPPNKGSFQNTYTLTVQYMAIVHIGLMCYISIHRIGCNQHFM